MVATDQHVKLEYFEHEVGGKFFYSSSPNPQDGLIGPFKTAEARNEAFLTFIHEQAVIAVQQELFG